MSAPETHEAMRPWAELPCHLLELIADRLEALVLDLLCFRGVCKGWRLASAEASVRCKFSDTQNPWFLLYNNDENSMCHLYDQDSDKSYTICIPELDQDATCIASRDGWLLVHREGSMWFFCPFTSAKIDLPQFLHTKLTNHVAVFTAPPTSADCVVCVINKDNDNTSWEIQFLRRGASHWEKHTCKDHVTKKITFAAYFNGSFCFLGHNNDGMYYNEETEKLNLFSIDQIEKEKIKSSSKTIILQIKSSFLTTIMPKLQLKKGDSISTCGTIVQRTCYPLCIHNEEVKGEEKVGEISHKKKGVFIFPRFFSLAPNQSWSEYDFSE